MEHLATNQMLMNLYFLMNMFRHRIPYQALDKGTNAEISLSHMMHKNAKFQTSLKYNESWNAKINLALWYILLRSSPGAHNHNSKAVTIMPLTQITRGLSNSNPRWVFVWMSLKSLVQIMARHWLCQAAIQLSIQLWYSIVKSQIRLWYLFSLLYLQ